VVAVEIAEDYYPAIAIVLRDPTGMSALPEKCREEKVGVQMVVAKQKVKVIWNSAPAGV